jgi:hypothetical protein
MPPDVQEAIERSWERVVYDCGCPDIYYCPTADDTECPRHGGFDVCCHRIADHVALPADLRRRRPKPPVPAENYDDE